MERSLLGRVAFVTGSGRGLGHAIAERLAEMGASVAIHDISAAAPAEFGEFQDLDDSAASPRRFGVETRAVIGDVSIETEVQSMIADIEANLGPISILVNCAGGDIAARGGKPVPNDALGVPMEDVHAILNRNLIGTMLVCRAVCPGMVERRHGAIVNFGSAAAHVGLTEGVAYAVAKAGIVHWTRCLAAELRPHNVRVNVVSPGATRTARFAATRVTDPALMEDSDSLERYGAPSDIASAVAFLVSYEARYISGQVLRVDGGLGLTPA